MTKTKKTKDLYPNIYGYGSLEQLMADPTRFGDNPDKPLTSWTAYKDADGDTRFVPCTEEFFHYMRNEERNDRRKKDIESRCMIPSEKYGLVKCREDCNHCPYKQNELEPDATTDFARTGIAVSIDYMYENYEFEFSDGSFEADCEKREKEERDAEMWRLIDELGETDQTILKLYNQGKTDAAIALVVKKSRSVVQERRVKLIDMLKEKLKNF